MRKQGALFFPTLLIASTGLLISYFLITSLSNRKKPNLLTNNSINTADNIDQCNDFSACIQRILNSNKKVVAFFDLDNTLIITIGYKPNLPRKRYSGYGSDIWFAEMFKKLDKTAANYQQLYMLLLSEYFIIQQHAQVMTTEDCVAEWLAKLHEKNIPIFGLTARSESISNITLQRLHELGIHFSHTNSDSIRLDLPAKDCCDNAIFKQGIIFCAGRSKRTCLDAFAKTTYGSAVFSNAEEIMFMDDKHSHCQDIQEYLREKKIASTIMHYTQVEDKLPVATNEEIAEDRMRLSQDLKMSFHF